MSDFLAQELEIHLAMSDDEDMPQPAGVDEGARKRTQHKQASSMDQTLQT